MTSMKKRVVIHSTTIPASSDGNRTRPQSIAELLKSGSAQNGGSRVMNGQGGPGSIKAG
jgi:hypothetical protein